MFSPSHAFVLGLIMSVVGVVGMFVDKRFMERSTWTWMYFVLSMVGGLVGMMAVGQLVIQNW
jgi:hypothetical protein